MTKREFMNILDRAMLGMDYDEKRGILNDYDEHFQIAMQEGKKEEDIVKDLGDPNEIAKNYMQRANIMQKQSDYEEAKAIDISRFETIGNDGGSAQTPEYTEYINDSNVYRYSISDVENIHAVLSISNVEIISQESSQDDKLLNIEVIYPAMMNENLEQYRISVDQVGNSININQKKKVWNFFNRFILKELPLVRITLPKSAKLNNLSIDTEIGSINMSSVVSYTLNINTISGYVHAETIKAINSKISSVSGSIKVIGLVSDTAKITSVSGCIELGDAVLNRCTLNNVSGSTDVCAKASFIESHNVSGKANIKVLSEYEYAKVSSVSGTVNLYAPDNVSFSANYNSVSGSISTDFVEINNKNKSGSFKYTAMGDSAKKSAAIHLSTVSGSMKVNKLITQ